jgi:hypothetical protein
MPITKFVCVVEIKVNVTPHREELLSIVDSFETNTAKKRPDRAM